jgi:type IV pilus assembly protein PilA
VDYTQRFKNAAGYTLVELLSVVAIIGIVAVIAVNSYHATVMRAHMQAAKADLSAIYAAEKNFYVNSFSYTLCLRNIGVPDSTQTYYWKGFFTQTHAPAGTCGPGGTQSCWAYDFNLPLTTCDCLTVVNTNGIGHTDCWWAANLNANAAGAFNNAYNWMADQTTFTAGAEGSISASNPADDTWTIDQTKNLVHFLDGE